MRIFIILAIVFLSCIGVAHATDPLLQSGDITYLGAFYLPSGWSTATDVPKAITYNPANNSLFAVTDPSSQYVAEISIPTLYTGALKSSLPTATILQSGIDITSGNRNKTNAGHTAYAGGGSVQIGGLAINNSKLIGGVYATYNANTETVYSHFVKGSLTLSTSDFAGLYQLGNVPSAGYIGGYLGNVPSAYQSAFGGDVITGNGYISVISQTSSGPSAFAYNASEMAGSNNTTINATPLLYYPMEHETLGAYGTTNQYVSINDRVMGVAFPAGTRSVLFFGRHGSGTSCYGVGTSDPAEEGRTYTSSPNTCNGETLTAGNTCCLDYSDHTHGTHSYPYHYKVWAYDSNDLAAVKSGVKQPWEPIPYTTWDLPLQWNDQGSAGFHVGINGVAYDATNKRLFINQVDTGIIQVFQVNANAYPVSGICGSSNGLSLSSTPTNLCSAGTASAVTGSGPWSWSCAGSGGGSTASCSASLTGQTVAAHINGRITGSFR